MHIDNHLQPTENNGPLFAKSSDEKSIRPTFVLVGGIALAAYQVISSLSKYLSTPMEGASYQYELLGPDNATSWIDNLPL